MKIVRGSAPTGERVEIQTMPDNSKIVDTFISLCADISETVFEGVYISEGFLPGSYNGQVKVGNLTCKFKISRDKE